MSTNDKDVDSLNEAYKEMYNVEQNEILQMNIESTIQRQKNLQKVDCQERAIENKDMSGYIGVFMDTHLQNVVNIGRPQNNKDVDSLNEAYKEMYNAEQNEILQMNIESTIQ